MNMILRRRRRTTGRTIPKNDWECLANYFESNSNRTIGNIRAYFFILATIGCGARPIEWIHAQLIDDKTIRLYTAKRRDTEKWEKIASRTDLELEKMIQYEANIETEINSEAEIEGSKYLEPMNGNETDEINGHRNRMTPQIKAELYRSYVENVLA